MNVYFFDTSALLKRYHSELGTEIVDAAFEEKDATRIISDLSVIEFYSALIKKVRIREIPEASFRGAVKLLAQDFQNRVIEITSVSDDDKRSAVILLEKYGMSQNLRTLDALQLAVMNRLGRQIITRILCADRTFVSIIEQEGFTVTNPEHSQ
jgi:predicted nucleic acid-binding protein